MLSKTFSLRTLYIVASAFWIFGGIKVLLIAHGVWHLSTGSRMYWLLLAFFYFNFWVFPRVAKENIQAIQATGKSRLPIYRCFTKKSWIIMVCMMTFGIVVRYSGYASYDFIAGFYTGLGISLIGVTRVYLQEGILKRQHGR